jgi:hypothetical protein
LNFNICKNEADHKYGAKPFCSYECEFLEKIIDLKDDKAKILSEV